MIKISHEIPSTEAYLSLRERADRGPREKTRAGIGLANSLFVVTIWKDDELIGFGRVVGDQGMYYVISDIMVDPNHRGKGHGKTIMHEINQYLEEHTDEHAYVCLIADKPADKLYQQFNFTNVEPHSIGMKRLQR